MSLLGYKNNSEGSAINKTILDEMCQGEYPIRPKNIDINRCVFLGNSMREITIRKIIGISQKRGSWLSFSENELCEYTNAFDKNKSVLKIEQNWDFWTFCADGKYRITHEFVIDAFRSAPKWTSWQSHRSSNKTTRIILWFIILFLISPITTAFIDNISGESAGVFARVAYMVNGSVLWSIFNYLFPRIFSRK